MDIVERLRADVGLTDSVLAQRSEAADEIERLRRVIPEQAQQTINKMGGDLLALQAEIERLRAARRNAYGLLWTYQGTDWAVHKARHLLLAELTQDEQKRGITFAQLEVLERQQ